ncbi:uncharacterized protein LOC142178406 [Nicotiana tabacum]|uniref:Uncharacterized protein LOC142178406 n=1 Tax=Nicotiana tabacum TaxID=4097 RepID=A0AC58U2Z3_TOBAC
MPSSVFNGVSHFQKVYNRQPSLEHLTVFGCLCYVKAVQERDKLMPRAIPAARSKYSPIFLQPNTAPDYSQLIETPHVPVMGHSDDHDKVLPQPNMGDTIDVTKAVLHDVEAAVVENEVRKSSRPKNPPIWLKDFVSLNVHEYVPYAIANYVSYTQVFPKYQAYLLTLFSIVEPITFVEASRDPRWIEAMKAYIEALESNHTWDIVTLPTEKVLIGCK